MLYSRIDKQHSYPCCHCAIQPVGRLDVPRSAEVTQWNTNQVIIPSSADPITDQHLTENINVEALWFWWMEYYDVLEANKLN